jgi:N-acetylglutamate synthase-like GNAT family acetyltransferase
MILNIQQKEYNISITEKDQPDLFQIEEFYQKGNGNFWVALYENKVVGTVSLLDIGNGEVALRKMFVAKEYRGSAFKISHLLLQTAIQWAKDHFIKAIYLGTTSHFLAGHRFYEKNGFVEVNQGDLPENFLVMKVDTKFYKYEVNEGQFLKKFNSFGS